MSGRDAEDVLQAVLGRLEGIRQQGGYWMAQCPAHEDRQASLAVRRGDRQPVILKCHAGCDPVDVAQAIGLDLAALCEPRAEQPGRGDLPPGAVKAYVYHDADGNTVFRKLRYEPKDFRIQRWDGSGWSWGKLGTGIKPLYRLPDVIVAGAAGKVVYVCEGEKDADSVRRAGAVATCNFDGAAKAGQRPKVRLEYAEWLRGADVIVIADDDEAGIAHARAWVGVLTGAAVRVRLAKSATGKDATDHLSAGRALTELVVFDDSADEDEDAELPGTPPFPHHLAQGPLRDMMDWAERDGLPVSYMGASAECAVATACSVAYCPVIPGSVALVPAETGAVLKVSAESFIYPVLWAALIGDSGTGKNPPPRIAAKQIRQRDAQLADMWETDPPQTTDEEGNPVAVPHPQSMIKTSATMEAIARWLAKNKGAGLYSNGELASFLRGLGQYKGGGGSDRYDAMDMWSGEAIEISRVGDGGAKNGINIKVPHPRMSVIGGLVPDNVHMLGNESDGLRARFLPVLPSSKVRRAIGNQEELPVSWEKLFDQLFSCDRFRTWFIRGEAKTLLEEAMIRWDKRQRNGADPKVIQTALAKADEQVMRLALVAAESEKPGEGGDIPVWAMEYAIARFEYALGCWLAIGSDQVMAFSRRDEVLARSVAELLRRIEARDPDENGKRWMTKTEIARAAIGGARISTQVDDLIRAYAAAYPGMVHVYSDKHQALFQSARRKDRRECPETGRGPSPVIVWAPPRSAPRGADDRQRADGKLAALRVSPPGTDGQPDGSSAGQGVVERSGSANNSQQTASAASYLLRVSDDWPTGEPPDDSDPWAATQADMEAYQRGETSAQRYQPRRTSRAQRHGKGH